MDAALVAADKPVYFEVSVAMHPTNSDHTELSLRPTSQTHPSRLTSSRTILHLSHTSSHNSDFVEPETDK